MKRTAKPPVRITLPGRPKWRVAPPPGWDFLGGSVEEVANGFHITKGSWGRTWEEAVVSDGQPATRVHRERISYHNYADGVPEKFIHRSHWYVTGLRQDDLAWGQDALELASAAREGSTYGKKTWSYSTACGGPQEVNECSPTHYYRVEIGPLDTGSRSSRLMDMIVLCYGHEWTFRESGPPADSVPGLKAFLRMAMTLAPPGVEAEKEPSGR